MNSTRMTCIVTLAALGHATASAAWTPVLLEPWGAGSSKATSAYGGVQAGQANFFGQPQAMLFLGNQDNNIDLAVGQKSWLASNAVSISGDQVGIAASTTGMGRGYVYSIKAQSLIDLTPPGMASAVVAGVDSNTNTQVGSGMGTMGMGAMLLWNGSAGGWVDLTPPGFLSSAAAGCANGVQVGNGYAGMMGRPFLTHGTAASAVDLTPAGATSAAVAGCDPTTQVGGVLFPQFGQGHAILWRGSAQNYMDLNPSFAAASSAAACWGNLQVGSYVPITGGLGQAVCWHSTAGSAEDLHQILLDTLGYQFVATEATGIDHVTGDIVGNAYTLVGAYLIPHAVMWKRSGSVVGDLNGDGVVDAMDIALLLSAWGTTGHGADLDGDGTVGAGDLAIVLSAWNV